MSSGSYFTIYRKHTKSFIGQDELNKTKNEYFLANKDEFFNSKDADEEKLREDLPVLMRVGFSHDYTKCDESSKTCIDKDGIIHDKLLEFHFCSTFTCLREKFSLNPYKFKDSSVIISKDEAHKMAQAAKYVLSRQYSREFEDILDNEYVELFGNGYSLFDERFSKRSPYTYIDKNSDDGYVVKTGDCEFDAETRESDNDVEFSLKRMLSCLMAFFDAECYSWENEELVLEYSVYG